MLYYPYMTPKKITMNRIVMNIVGILVIVFGILMGASMSEETGSSVGDALGELFAPWFAAGGCLVGIFILVVNNWKHLKAAYARVFTPENPAAAAAPADNALPSLSVAERTPLPTQKRGFFSNRRNGLLVIAFPITLAIIGFATSLFTQWAYDAGLLESSSGAGELFQLLYGLGQIVGVIGIITFFPCLIAGIAIILTGSRPVSNNKPPESR